MNNLFDMSMGQLTEFAVGDDLLADTLNQPIAAINRAMQVRVRPPHQVEYPTLPRSPFEFVMIDSIVTGFIRPMLDVVSITYQPSGSEPWTIEDGTFRAFPWPGYPSSLYRSLLRGLFDPPEAAPIVSLITVNGLPFVSLDLKWDVRSLPAGVNFTSCPEDVDSPFEP